MTTCKYLCSPAEWHQLYQYTADLLALNFCRNPTPHDHATLNTITTPLNTLSWQRALSTHSDQALAQYILEGLTEGFRIGFMWGSPLRSASSNMQSATQHPTIISDYLQKEKSLERLLGPFTSAEVPLHTHINRFGVIP